MKTRKLPHSRLKCLLTTIALAGTAAMVLAQGTAFTYQGRLNDSGSPANGVYDLRFVLHGDPVLPGFQVGLPQTNSPVAVSNGLFTVVLNFGFDVFTGSARWLELGVRTNGGGAFNTLAPRQAILPAPYAMHAQFAGDIEPGANVSFSGNGVVSFHAPTPFYLGPFATNTVMNLSAQFLAGKDAGRFWWLGGNSGQLPSDYVLGTLDNNPLEFKVNGQRALRIDPAPDGPNIVGGLAGFHPTVIANGVRGAVVAGGGAPAGPVTGYGGGDFHAVYDSDGAIGGGFGNKVGSDNSNVDDAPFGTVAGGVFNTANNYASTVAGGDGNWAGGVRSAVLGGAANTALSTDSAVGGGVANRIQGDSAGSAIAGGQNNTINSNAPNGSIGGGEWNSVTGPYAVVPGGSGNTAASFALAAGRRAKANHAGAFVWADSTDADFASTGNDQMVFRASGGVGINTNNTSGAALTVNGLMQSLAGGVKFPDGSVQNKAATRIIASVDMQFSQDDRSGWTHVEALGDDNVINNIPLGFNYTGFGVATTTVSLSSNGVLFFGSNANSSFSNGPLPSAITQDAALFFFWDDLYDYGSGEFMEYATYGSAGGRVFNLYFHNRLLSSSCGADAVNVMISIHESSNLIKVSYSGFSNCFNMRGGSATIGFQTPGGLAAAAFVVGVDSPVLDDNAGRQTISFHPPN